MVIHIRGEVFTLVKIPLSEIEELVRSKHNLPEVMTDVQIEGDSLVLYFREKHGIESPEELVKTEKVKTKKRKRIRRKRNRMRTRGWRIVARFQNSKGQKCAIYEPFVEALKHSPSGAEQKLIVAKILRSNGNRPSEASIEYFLENTLEYLKMQEKQPSTEA